MQEPLAFNFPNIVSAWNIPPNYAMQDKPRQHNHCFLKNFGTERENIEILTLFN
jgi:hypothetical protein